MVEGKVVFQDLLGKTIVSIDIERDLRVEPGQEAQQAGTYSAFMPGTTERLLALPPEDVRLVVRVDRYVTMDNRVVSLR